MVPYEEAKKDIRARLGEERIQKEYQAYLDTLRQKAVIQIQVREVPLQLSGPVPENALLDTPLLGGGGSSLGLGAEPRGLRRRGRAGGGSPFGAAPPVPRKRRSPPRAPRNPSAWRRPPRRGQGPRRKTRRSPRPPPL